MTIHQLNNASSTTTRQAAASPADAGAPVADGFSNSEPAPGIYNRFIIQGQAPPHVPGQSELQTVVNRAPDRVGKNQRRTFRIDTREGTAVGVSGCDHGRE